MDINSKVIDSLMYLLGTKKYSADAMEKERINYLYEIANIEFMKSTTASLENIQNPTLINRIKNVTANEVILLFISFVIGYLLKMFQD